jgi:uncharacterized RDD family membrane protein YckC
MPSPRPSAPPPSRLRESVARFSRPLLERLTAAPAAVPFLAMLALLVAGIFVGGPIGAVLIGVVALFVAWLLYLGWPRLTTAERMGRGAVLAVAVALCLVQVFPPAS